MEKKRTPASKPLWRKKRPPKKRKKLSASQKQAAKTRAAKAGRRYPNLVDNMWASSGGSARKKKTKTRLAGAAIR